MTPKLEITRVTSCANRTRSTLHGRRLPSHRTNRTVCTYNKGENLEEETALKNILNNVLFFEGVKSASLLPPWARRERVSLTLTD
ncbi:hypothetical protein SFRURICE_019833 [Spodoptera frugiperda]|nr:hypothetical protein SFRURICE_019833 [Spodoptera frugiperda]